MKPWKRIFSCLLAGAMLMSLAACSGRDGAADGQSDSQNQEQTAAEPEADAAVPESAGVETAGGAEADAAPAGEGDAAEPGGVLVVYYSATGNTEAVAGYIVEATGADTFCITPSDPYTEADLNWRDESSRVVYEHDNPDAQTVALTATEVPNWEDYDTVFLGYPIWWGEAAWPVSTFVAANDFTGKTVIPFCTSSSSGLGSSGELLAELAGTGDWQEGRRFRSGADESDVADWVRGLGLSAQ